MPVLGAISHALTAVISMLLWAVAGLITGLVGLAGYRLLAHPLANIPGPRVAAISNVWYAYQIRNGRSRTMGRTLHQTYGPAVRVGPNEIWFDSKEAFRAIYHPGSKFEKADFYLSTALPRPELNWKLQPYPVDSLDLLSERDIKRYRRQRRAIGPVYQPSALTKHEKAIDSVLARAVEKLQNLRGEEVDLKEWMHMIVVECLGAVVLSWSPGMIRNGTDWGTSAHSYLSWRRKSVFGLFPTIMKLSYLSKFLDRVFSLVWRITYRPPAKFKTFFPEVGKRVSKRINVALHRQTKPGAHRDLLADLIEMHERRDDFPELYLKRMAVTNFGAGHETLASTLTSIFALLGSHPAIFQRLAREVRPAGRGGNSMVTTRMDFGTLATLPFLQASVKEAKRLRPVIGMALPRRVPHGGAVIHGYFIPSGATVGINPVALHCNPDICGSDPDRFDPAGRWLSAGPVTAFPDADGTELTSLNNSQGDGTVETEEADAGIQHRIKDMETFSLSWGGGSRTCPGRHLAELVLLKAVAALSCEFDIEAIVPAEENMPSYFMAMPTGVKARFLKPQR